MILYDHQQKIIEEDKPKAGLFLGTGSGKTRIALLLAKGRTLVIAPKTQVLDKNWEREYGKLLFRGFDMLTVISKETFRRDHAKLPAYDTVIVDEAHTVLGVTPNVRYRNRKPIPKTSQLFEALEAYLRRTKPARMYLCTATIIRSPMTVWAAGKLLGYKWSFYGFRDRFYVRLPMPGREVWTAKNDEATKDHLARIVRNIGYTGRLEDFVDMPEQVFKTDYVELTLAQKTRIKKIPIDYPDPLVGSLKTHMVENGILNGDEFSGSEIFDNQKIDKILDYSIEFPKLVIFARYKGQISQIAKALEKENKKVFILTGDTKDRGAIIAEAKNTKEYVFVCQSSISAGWELNDCPTVIFASLDFSIVNLIQAQGRISRINNPKRNLYIYLITKRGIDEHIYKTVAINKMDFHLAQFDKVRYN